MDGRAYVWVLDRAPDRFTGKFPAPPGPPRRGASTCLTGFGSTSSLARCVKSAIQAWYSMGLSSLGSPSIWTLDTSVDDARLTNSFYKKCTVIIASDDPRLQASLSTRRGQEYGV